jgi:predicted HTH domain antitoxin
MPSIMVTVPESVTAAEAQLYLAIKLYELGRLSCGQAAEAAGYSKVAFLEILGKNGVPVFDQPSNTLADDLRHA